MKIELRETRDMKEEEVQKKRAQEDQRERKVEREAKGKRTLWQKDNKNETRRMRRKWMRERKAPMKKK